MKKSLSVMLLFCVLFFAACKEEGTPELPDGTMFSANYIYCYVYSVESLYMVCEPNPDPDYTLYGDGIYLTMTGQECTPEDNAEKFEELSEQFGDVSFDKSEYKGKRNLRQLTCYSEAIQKIVVTSDKDFDAEHPSGTPLTDIVYFSAATAYPFVSNGYKPWNEESGRYDGGYQLVRGLLTELNMSDLQLLSTDWMYIDFPVKPIAGEHTISVKIELQDGKTIEGSIKKTF